MKKHYFNLLISCLLILWCMVLSIGCSSINAKKSKDSVRSFVIEHESELNAVIDELYCAYEDELKHNKITDITSDNLKPNCPATESFFDSYSRLGYTKITLLDNKFVQIIKKGGTGNPWTYIGFYFSPTESPYRFFDGNIEETMSNHWEETLDGSDNSSESDLICDGWYVFLLYF